MTNVDLKNQTPNDAKPLLDDAAVNKLEIILLDLNIGRVSVRVAKTKILKLIENEKQKYKS